jgi:hypothetical protein
MIMALSVSWGITMSDGRIHFKITITNVRIEKSEKTSGEDE